MARRNTCDEPFLWFMSSKVQKFNKSRLLILEITNKGKKGLTVNG